MGSRTGTTKAAPAQDSKAAANPRKKMTNAVIAVILILAGVEVLLYPVLATQWNNFAQTRAADEYSKLEKSVPQEVLDTAWNEAHAYNDALQETRIMDAWNDHADENSEGYKLYKQYLSVLSEADAMGRVIIPAINSDLPLFTAPPRKLWPRAWGTYTARTCRWAASANMRSSPRTPESPMQPCGTT